MSNIIKHKIIWMGFPMTLEEGSDGIPIISGFWAFMLDLFGPFEAMANGGWTFTVYEGSYWMSLWEWLNGSV